VSQFYQIHPENPQLRLIHRAVEIIQKGGVVVFPTDSTYALGCHLSDRQAVERVRQIRQLSDKHHMTLVCRNLSELGVYARVEDNRAFRLIKSHTPGPYTFLLKATKEVPKRLSHPKRKSIGIRIPDNKILQTLLMELGEPLMSTSLILPGEQEALMDPFEMRERLEHQVDLIVDGGYGGNEPTTMIDLFEGDATILREGLGSIE